MNEEYDYFTMLFQLKAITNYADSYLLSLSEEELKKIYIEKVQYGKESKR